MLSLFRAITDRVKAMFVTNAALEFEAELLARDAERKAELLRLADAYEKEGMTTLAEQLRRQTEGLSLQRPLASVLPSLTSWQGGEVGDMSSSASPSPAVLPFPAGGKRAGSSAPPNPRKGR